MWGYNGLARIEFKGVGPFPGQRTFKGAMGVHILEEITVATCIFGLPGCAHMG